MYAAAAPATLRTLADICAFLGLSIPDGANADRLIVGVRPLDSAESDTLSVFSNAAYTEDAKITRAGVVLTDPQGVSLLPKTCVALVAPQPYVAFAKVLEYCYPPVAVNPGIASTAVVSGSARVAESARIEPGAILYAGVEVGEGAHIGAYTVLGPGVSVGSHTKIAPHCSIFRTTIGTHCIVHPGACIGQDGFGFALEGTTLHKVPQLGGVTIGNRVEIGANCTIDAGALDNTVIEDDVKLDNQVQIAHNVRVGKSTRIVAQSGVAGSTTLGAFNLIGGQCGVVGHIETAPGVALAARTALTKTVTEQGAVLAGMPAQPINEWRKGIATLNRMVKKGLVETDQAFVPAPAASKPGKKSAKVGKPVPAPKVAEGGDILLSDPDTDASPF